MLRWILVLLGLAHASLAGAVTPQDVRRMVAELIPEVEERAGREFVTHPDSGILTRAQAVDTAMKPPASLMGEVEVVPYDKEKRAAELQFTIAIYIFSSEGVYLIQESMTEAFEALGLEAKALEPVIRCAVRHELVHALQHQYGVRPRGVGPGGSRGYRALVEGHATLIGQELCREKEGAAIAAAMDGLLLADVPSSVKAGDPIAPYSWGRIVADRLRTVDDDAIWSLLAAPPPDWDDIVETVEPLLTPGWDDPGSLKGLEDLLTYGSDGIKGPRSATMPLSALLSGNPPSLMALPQTEAGLARMNMGWGGWAEVNAFLFREPGAAREMIVMRRRTRNSWQAGLRTALAEVNDFVEVIPADLRRLERRDDVTDTLWLRLDTDTVTVRGYNEYWVATEHVLLVATKVGYKRKRKEVEAELALALDALPSVPKPHQEPERPAWLTAAAPPEPGPSWEYRLQLAARQFKAGHEAPCEWAFGDVRRGDIQPGDDLAVAAVICMATVNDAAGILAHVDQALAHEPRMAPYVARSLLTTGQNKRAQAILVDACPRLEGDAAEHCRDLLQNIR